MDEKDRELLRATLKLTQENHRMMQKMYRGWWWGRIWKTLYWLVIIGIALGTFYFLQPYIDKVLKLYDVVRPQIQGNTTNQAK